MGVGGSKAGYKSLYPALIHLYRLAWRKILSDHNLLILLTVKLLLFFKKHRDQALGNIPHICGPCLHIVIIHLLKHDGKIVRCNSHCILCIDLLGPDHIFDRLLIILILQHHLMYVKNRCAGLSNFLKCLIIELP